MWIWFFFGNLLVSIFILFFIVEVSYGEFIIYIFIFFIVYKLNWELFVKLYRLIRYLLWIKLNIIFFVILLLLNLKDLNFLFNVLGCGIYFGFFGNLFRNKRILVLSLWLLFVVVILL